MLGRVWNLAWKEFVHFVRDRVMTPFIILGPVLQLVLLAWATSQDIEHLSTAILDLDRSADSRALVTALENPKTLDVVVYPTGLDEVRALLDSGQAMVALIIPPGFARDLASPSVKPQVQLIIDGSNSIAAGMAKQVAEGAIERWSRDLARQRKGQPIPSPPIDLRVTARFNPELDYGTHAIPAELGFVVYLVTLMVAAMSIAREREMGTLEQLLVMPVRHLELIAGKAIPAAIIAYLDFLLMLALVVYGFGIPMHGSLPLLLGLTMLFIATELCWGILISAVAHTQQQALLFVFLLAMLDMAFSGYLTPVENMPFLLRTLSNLFPIKHYTAIVRHIMVKGVTLHYLWVEVVALALLGMASLVVTLLLLRRPIE